jgi:glycosyltransferase involved in cell wall biosynthesis
MFKFFVEDNLCEIPFLKEIEKHLKDKINTNINVVDVRNLNTLPFNSDKNTCVLLLSDEHYSIPGFIKNVKLVFKTGVSEKNTKEHTNLIPFPLGYTKKFNTRNTIKNIKERPIDVFFAGQILTADRDELVQQILKLKQNNPRLNIIHNVSPSFLNGFSGETYSELMYNSKICLCPAGTTIPETFRYYEAFKAGSVVFTKNYLPETILYKSAPVVRLENWNQLDNAVNHFLGKPELMQKYFNNTIKFQQEHYEPRAIAEYIINTLNECCNTNL